MDEKFEIDNSNNQEIKNGEETNAFENCADREKGEEKTDEVVCEKIEADGEEIEACREKSENGAEEAKAAEAEGEDSQAEAESASPQAESSDALNAAPTFSTVYRASEDGYRMVAETDSDKKKRSSKKKKVLAIVSLVLAAVILLGALGGSTLYFAMKYFDAISEQEPTDIPDIPDIIVPENSNGDEVTIVEDDGEINVNDEVYVPAGESMALVDVVEKVAASVVEVSTLTASNYGQYVSSGAGSGVIIAQGDNYSYIATNYHVVGGSDSITVRLNDKREFEAIYMDGDEASDIAVIKIKETRNITMAKIGKSSSLRVGQDVFAIGNPLGELGGTVTDGIVSALDREITVDGTTMTLLQTNAAVNPGNSGGGLFNMAGELIAIVNAKQSATGIEGLGFAIPIDIVKDDLFEIINDGYIHGRVSFGIDVTYLDSYSAYYYFRSRNAGLYVTGTTNSEFKQGDRITEVNSKSVSSINDLKAIIGTVKVGDKVTFRVVRDNTSMDIVITAKEYIPSNDK